MLVTAIATAYGLNYVEEPAAGGPFVCVECGGSFKSEDIIRIDSHIICARCKPVFMQKLSEGAHRKS